MDERAWGDVWLEYTQRALDGTADERLSPAVRDAYAGLRTGAAVP